MSTRRGTVKASWEGVGLILFLVLEGLRASLLEYHLSLTVTPRGVPPFDGEGGEGGCVGLYCVDTS